MMQGARFSLGELSAVCANVFPPFDEREQHVALATYRALAGGEPVPVEQIAQTTGLRQDEVQTVLTHWKSRVHFDRERRVVAFMGLDLLPSAHRFEVNGRTLHTWCAWDTLFIPRVLGRAARVESACPVTGRTVSLLSTPEGVRELQPASTMVSFIAPESTQVERDVIASFCCHVHFLSSAEAAEQWLARHEGSLILTVEEAWELGRACVAARLPLA